MRTFVASLMAIQIALGTSLRKPPDLGSDCNFDLTQLDPEPIVVTASGHQFLYPAPSASTVSISAGESILISCPGGTLSLGSAPSGTAVTATCQSGNTFTANGSNFNFTQIGCSRSAYHTARYTGNSCEADGREIEIGFLLTATSSSFARQITICFNDTNKTSLYAHYNITKSIIHHESEVPRPYFIEDDFYGLGVTVNSLYVRTNQRTTINRLLGLPENSTEYIQDASDFYLARGHFAAKADFVYATEQTATFHYVNVAPQWQTFNGDNWETVEDDVRNYADASGVDLKLYTGTYGVTTLPHSETGEETPLYLYADSNGNRALPVPELYWKVAYNPQNKQGVALIGINNPYQQNVTRSIICKDVSSQITWLHWYATDLQSGYSYACAVDDFRSTVSYLPQFDVLGLLI